MTSQLKNTLSQLKDLSECEVSPRYDDFPPDEQRLIFRAWVEGMDKDDAFELMEASDEVFEECKRAWHLALRSSGDNDVGFQVPVLTLELTTDLPMLNDAIHEVWYSYQPADEWCRYQNDQLASTGL